MRTRKTRKARKAIGRRKLRKEEVAEDYCFSCKDGGLLRICDYKDCLKSYHPLCVEKDDYFLKAKERWTCGWHSCCLCQKASKFYCYCCPRAICGRCTSVAEFAHVRGDKGLCNNCLKLALLVEEGKDVDSDGDMIDFKDRGTVEFLFMEYWEIIKEKEGLTLENLHSADALLKKNLNSRTVSDLEEFVKGEEEYLLTESDYEDMGDIGKHKYLHKRKITKGQPLVISKKVKKEFIEWGSKPLIEFLASIGKDTSVKLSQYDVTSIINEYIRKNELFHPEKKKKVVCDAKLKSVLGRKSVSKHKIYDVLDAHFAENFDQSEEDEDKLEVDEKGYSSYDKSENLSKTCSRHRKFNLDGKSQKAEVVLNIQQSCFASIIPKNIKLVYLKKSLVEELLKQPDAFEDKVMGSFVRVKCDPNDYTQKNSHQLVKVTGMNKNSTNTASDSEVLLQVTNVPIDVRICMLSNVDFTEEECEELRRRVNEGLFARPTVVEFEQKARILHEDITKQWIGRELNVLQNLIDQANEKGWRRQLFEYIERRQLLQTPSEQSRLLQELPKVIAEVIELEPTAEECSINNEQGHNDLLKSGLQNPSRSHSSVLEGSGTTAFMIGLEGEENVSNENAALGITGLSSSRGGNGNEQAISCRSCRREARAISQDSSRRKAAPILCHVHPGREASPTAPSLHHAYSRRKAASIWCHVHPGREASSIAPSLRHVYSRRKTAPILCNVHPRTEASSTAPSLCYVYSRKKAATAPI